MCRFLGKKKQEKIGIMENVQDFNLFKKKWLKRGVFFFFQLMSLLYGGISKTAARTAGALPIYEKQKQA